MEAPRKTIKGTFLTGFVVVLPLLVTYSILKALLGQIHSSVTPFLFSALDLLGLGGVSGHAGFDMLAPLVSIAVAACVIYGLGWLGSLVFGKHLLAGFDKLLLQVPVVRGIYAATRQFLDTFASGEGRAFRQVVLIEYPRSGLWTLGLVTSEGEEEITTRLGRRMLAVFVPTTPNPTSGFLLYVPVEDAIVLTMNVDDAFKLIISGGVLHPK